MKRFTVLCVLFVLALSLLLSACNDPANGGLTTGAVLVNTVYAGEDADGAWATFAFIDEDTVYYFPDNAACYDGTYACYTGGSGEIMAINPGNRAANDSPGGTAPGSFTISVDGKTITFTAYLGQGTRSFHRVRDADAVDEEELPFTCAPLTAGSSIDRTVWAGTALRTRDWTPLTVTATDVASGTIQVSHSFDCTSNSRAYSAYAYNQETALAYTGPFRINGDTFTFLNFYGHGGEITLKRMR